LERSMLLSADPARHAERILAAAQASMQAGAFWQGPGTLATAEAGPLDEFQSAPGRPAAGPRRRRLDTRGCHERATRGSAAGRRYAGTTGAAVGDPLRRGCHACDYLAACSGRNWLLAHKGNDVEAAGALGEWLDLACGGRPARHRLAGPVPPWGACAHAI
jgi:hypothetical protein